MRFYVIIFYLLLASAQSVVAKDVSDADKAKALNGQIDILMQRMNETSDSDYYYSTVMDIVKNTVLCDFYDSKPDKKGRVRPKFREENAKRTTPIRSKVIDGGMFYYNHHNNDRALDALELYIETSDNAMFANTNHDLDFVTYYASLLAFGMKNYKKAEYYADMTLKHPNYAKDAAEIKINCMKNQLSTKNDSNKYVVALLEMHNNAPENRDYFLMLMDYFTSPGHENEVTQFAKDEIKKDSTNSLAWIMIGEQEMNARQWDDAIHSYGKAVEVDSSLVQAIYNIGICYSSKAIEMKDSLVDDRGRLSKAERQDVREVFSKSMTFLEKAEESDPDMKLVDWATPLYQVYFVLGDKDKADKMKELSKHKKE